MLRSRLSLLVRLGTVVATIWLLGLHAAIFWQRLTDASIAKPSVFLRWLAALLLVGGAVAFYRYGGRQWRRRHAGAIFWLLVVLLHLGIPAGESLLDRHQVVTLVQAGLVTISVALLVLALVAASDVKGPNSSACLAGPHAWLTSDYNLYIPRSPPCL